jgi:DNA-binding transcriptional ArsR family regulator
MPDEFDYWASAAALEVVANPVRLRIILALLDGPLGRKQLILRCRLPRTTVAYHLKPLQRAGVIISTGVDDRTGYSLSGEWVESNGRRGLLVQLPPWQITFFAAEPARDQ